MKASLRNIRISPKKMNLVAELVRGETAEQAEKILTFTPKRGAKPMKKVLKSAVANAKNNFKQNPADLIVKEVKVSKGYTLQRFIPGSRGRGKPILKYSSHVHIMLGAKSKGQEAQSAEPKARGAKPKKEETPKTEMKAPKAKKSTTKSK